MLEREQLFATDIGRVKHTAYDWCTIAADTAYVRRTNMLYAMYRKPSNRQEHRAAGARQPGARAAAGLRRPQYARLHRCEPLAAAAKQPVGRAPDGVATARCARHPGMSLCLPARHSSAAFNPCDPNPTPLPRLILVRTLLHPRCGPALRGRGRGGGGGRRCVVLTAAGCSRACKCVLHRATNSFMETPPPPPRRLILGRLSVCAGTVSPHM
jgi:hypothetical protein